jgi:hypothetical protein
MQKYSCCPFQVNTSCTLSCNLLTVHDIIFSCRTQQRHVQPTGPTITKRFRTPDIPRQVFASFVLFSVLLVFVLGCNWFCLAVVRHMSDYTELLLDYVIFIKSKLAYIQNSKILSFS